MTTYMSRLFPKSNSSFFLSRGNALIANVLRLKDEKILVDAGPGSARICMQDEGVAVIKKSTRFENKVGCLDLVAGESLVRKKLLERMFIDLVAGDQMMKDRATSRFDDLIGSTDVVAGEPLLLLPRRFRQHQAWMEIVKAWRTNSKVRGFVIKKVRRGYAVAIAGYITYLPFRPMIRRRLSNDRFSLENHSQHGKKNIVVF